MSKPKFKGQPVFVRVQFEDEHRAGMDLENALDAFEQPADVTYIEDDIRMAIGALEQYHDKHRNVGAKNIANHLKSLLAYDEPEEGFDA